jgi:hypothetical protein
MQNRVDAKDRTLALCPEWHPFAMSNEAAQSVADQVLACPHFGFITGAPSRGLFTTEPPAGGMHGR